MKLSSFFPLIAFALFFSGCTGDNPPSENATGYQGEGTPRMMVESAANSMLENLAAIASGNFQAPLCDPKFYPGGDATIATQLRVMSESQRIEARKFILATLPEIRAVSLSRYMEMVRLTEGLLVLEGVPRVAITSPGALSEHTEIFFQVDMVINSPQTLLAEIAYHELAHHLMFEGRYVSDDETTQAHRRGTELLSNAGACVVAYGDLLRTSERYVRWLIPRLHGRQAADLTEIRSLLKSLGPQVVDYSRRLDLVVAVEETVEGKHMLLNLLIRRFVGRDATPAELTFFSDAEILKYNPERSVPATLLTSAEYLSALGNPSFDELVKHYFTLLLGRAPTGPELGALFGSPPSGIVNYLTEKQEYRGAWISYLYHRVLSRAPSSGEIANGVKADVLSTYSFLLASDEAFLAHSK